MHPPPRGILADPCEPCEVILLDSGVHAGSISLLVSCYPPSCSGKCLKHGCSGTADFGQVEDMWKWVANGSLYLSKSDHLGALPRRPGAVAAGAAAS